MHQNLEDVIKGEKRPDFKSEGERRIAHFLDSNAIKYRYEPSILVNSDEHRPRIWYPDFYLPEFGTYIEYYGLAGQKNYDHGIKTKETVYSKMGMEVVPVYPWMFAENWQDYIMKELKRGTIRKYKNLKSKPYWSKQKTRTYNNTMPAHFGYSQRLSNRY
ncbi:hypothetical protein ACFL03_15610 [Thermodesulfobacteriota bacterium]